MSSSEEADDFWRRNTSCQQTSVTRPRKRRKSSHSPPADSSDDSSEVEVVPSPVKRSSKKTSSTTKAKGKGKEKEKAKAPTKKSTAGTGKARKNLPDFSSSEEDEAEPSSTQLEERGDSLRQMARETAHWQGSTPERRAKQREEKEAQERRKRENKDIQRDLLATDSDSDDSSSRSRRRTSASTAQTSLSSSSGGKKRSTTGKKAAAPKSAKASTSKPRRKRASTPDDRSTSPQLQPPPPKPFWQSEAALSASTAQAPKHVHGEATKKLRSLGEQRQMLVLPDEDENDEIAVSSDGEAAPEKYELSAVKAKREKAESLARLKAKRSNAKLPLQAAPNGTTPLFSPKANKRKGLPSTAPCDVCNEQVATDTLAQHQTTCIPIECLDSTTDVDLLPAPPPKPPTRLAAAATSFKSGAGFRPAGTGSAAAPRQPKLSAPQNRLPPPAQSRENALPRLAPGSAAPLQDSLSKEIFPSSSPPIQRKSAAHPARTVDKGKGKSQTLVEDTDEEDAAPLPRNAQTAQRRAPSAPAQEEPDEYGDEGFFDENDPELEAVLSGHGGGLGRQPQAAPHRTEVLTLEDDDDDEAIVFTGPSRAGTSKGKGKAVVDGSVGELNASRRPGPPENGSSPPRGSLYVSTLGRAYKEGYERMYTRSRARGGGAGDGLDGDDDDAFQAQFAPASKVARGRGSRGGGGGGRKKAYGGWRTGRSWKGKGRK
ncbi:hypothetical protein JCM11641_004286 [Rhodosporidiobolus odoratus]